MARGVATQDAPTMSTLEESAVGMARGATTWDVSKMSSLEMSAEGMARTAGGAGCLVIESGGEGGGREGGM